MYQCERPCCFHERSAGRAGDGGAAIEGLGFSGSGSRWRWRAGGADSDVAAGAGPAAAAADHETAMHDPPHELAGVDPGQRARAGRGGQGRGDGSCYHTSYIIIEVVVVVSPRRVRK